LNLRNKFEAWCHDCRVHIPVGAGYLLPKDEAAGRWRVACAGCFSGTTATPPPRPAPTRPIYIPPCLKVLGLTPPVDRDLIKRKYRQLAMTNHPDMGGDAARFMAIEGAYREAMNFAGGARS